MSIEQRLARAERKMSPGTFGGRSRAATPVDRKAKRVEAAVNPSPFMIYATGLQSLPGTGTVGVDLDGATIVDGCGGITLVGVGAPTLVEVPAGSYPGAAAEVTFDVASGGVTRLVGITAYDSAFNEVGDNSNTGTGDTLSVALGAFVIPPGGGYVGMSASKASAPTTTISETSFLTIECAS